MVHGDSLFLEVISGIASSMCLHSLKLASTHSFKSSGWLPLNCQCLHCCAYGLLPQHLENHSDAKNAVELTSSDQQLGVDKHLDSLTSKVGQPGAICGAPSQSFHPGVSLSPLLVRWRTESICVGRLPLFHLHTSLLTFLQLPKFTVALKSLCLNKTQTEIPYKLNLLGVFPRSVSEKSNSTSCLLLFFFFPHTSH